MALLAEQPGGHRAMSIVPPTVNTHGTPARIWRTWTAFMLTGNMRPAIYGMARAPRRTPAVCRALGGAAGGD